MIFSISFCNGMNFVVLRQRLSGSGTDPTEGAGKVSITGGAFAEGRERIG